MSHVLLFSPGASGVALTDARFRSHFEAREHYEVDDACADYLHADTGVAFRFARESGAARDADAHAVVASFELAYGRPRFFARDAAREIAAFADAFGLLVRDARGDGAPAGTFDEATFLRAWDDENRRASEQFVRSGLARPVRASARMLELAHAWNLARGALQRRLGEEVFVPSVMFGELEGALVTLVVWADGVPTLLPSFVDQVMVYRDELAPMRTLVFRETRPAMLSRAAAVAFLGDHAVEDDSLHALRPTYVDLPRPLAAAITALPPLEAKLVTLPAEQLVDDDVDAP